MRSITSRHIKTRGRNYYSAELINQAYGSDGIKVKSVDFNINLLQGFYGTKPETIVFYDLEREKLEKSLKGDEELTQ
ncbi:hypothetical protein [Haloimpatiens massiliensis]|uniref:hypothetical protein n=1 Tax=Haloimpatiens massiliensis TaxID=1658110 RepID=UPI000C83F734|nr:hypothetical protein [Haloimpatiens massiliensis]